MNPPKATTAPHARPNPAIGPLLPPGFSAARLSNSSNARAREERKEIEEGVDGETIFAGSIRYGISFCPSSSFVLVLVLVLVLLLLFFLLFLFFLFLFFLFFFSHHGAKSPCCWLGMGRSNQPGKTMPSRGDEQAAMHCMVVKDARLQKSLWYSSQGQRSHTARPPNCKKGSTK